MTLRTVHGVYIYIYTGSHGVLSVHIRISCNGSMHPIRDVPVSFFFPQPKDRFHRYIIYHIYIYSVYISIYIYIYMIQLLRSWEYRSAKQLLFDMGHHEEVAPWRGCRTEWWWGEQVATRPWSAFQTSGCVWFFVQSMDKTWYKSVITVIRCYKSWLTTCQRSIYIPLRNGIPTSPTSRAAKNLPGSVLLFAFLASDHCPGTCMMKPWGNQQHGHDSWGSHGKWTWWSSKSINIPSGGWWLEHVFFHILGISSSQLTNSIIFQRGRYTTN